MARIHHMLRLNTNSTGTSNKTARQSKQLLKLAATARHTGAHKARKFVRESLAICVEKECVSVVREILGIDCQTRFGCRRVLGLLQEVRAAFRKRDRALTWARSGGHVDWMKRIKWSQFVVGTQRVPHQQQQQQQRLEMGDTLLHYACRLGKTCFIDVLLEFGDFNVNAKNSTAEQDTPLCIAADFGWVDTAKYLIRRGATVNIENAKYKTPLILATELKYPYDVSMCSLLIKHGKANVNMATCNMNTVLLSAAKFGNMELIQLLVRSGADLNVQYNDGATCLMRACYYDYVELVSYLLSCHANRSIEMTNKRRETALYIAAFRGHSRIVELMVKNFGANVNCQDIDGDTPLTVACYEAKPKVIKFLLEHGALTNTRGIRGDTPLHIAVSNCDNSIVMDLIRHGADVDAVNFEDETPLHIAARQNNLNVLVTLCSHARNLNATSNYAITPFRNLLETLSSSFTKLEMLVVLIEAGCDVTKSFIQMKDEIGVSHFNASPLDFLFNLFDPRIAINSHPLYGDDQIGIVLLQLFTQVVWLIIKSGYRPTQLDCKKYSESAVHEFLSDMSINESTFEHPVRVYEQLDAYIQSLLAEWLNQPSPLTHLCRTEVRNLLSKPILNSVYNLNIPNQLELFLLFQQ